MHSCPLQTSGRFFADIDPELALASNEYAPLLVQVAPYEWVLQEYVTGAEEHDGAFIRSFAHVTCLEPSSPDDVCSYQCTCAGYASNVGLFDFGLVAADSSSMESHHRCLHTQVVCTTPPNTVTMALDAHFNQPVFPIWQYEDEFSDQVACKPSQGRAAVFMHLVRGSRPCFVKVDSFKKENIIRCVSAKGHWGMGASCCTSIDESWNTQKLPPEFASEAFFSSSHDTNDAVLQPFHDVTATLAWSEQWSSTISDEISNYPWYERGSLTRGESIMCLLRM